MSDQSVKQTDDKPKKGRPGDGTPGPGRPKGIPNKSTVEFRETISKLLGENAENIAIWLSDVAEKDPAKALDLLAKLAEFAAPKLSRTELSGPNGKELVAPQFIVTPVKPAGEDE